MMRDLILSVIQCPGTPKTFTALSRDTGAVSLVLSDSEKGFALVNVIVLHSKNITRFKYIFLQLYQRNKVNIYHKQDT